VLIAQPVFLLENGETNSQTDSDNDSRNLYRAQAEVNAPHTPLGYGYWAPLGWVGTLTLGHVFDGLGWVCVEVDPRTTLP